MENPKMMKKIKIGNVEFDGQYISVDEDNPYFNQKEKYESKGWVRNDGVLSKGSCHIDIGLLGMEKTKLVVGKIVFSTSGDEFDVMSYGMRCFELNDDDFKDFKRVLAIVQEEMFDQRENN